MTSRIFNQALLLIILALLLASCGTAEWPPRGQSEGQVSSSTPATSTSNLSFISATAVRVGPGDTLYAISRRHKVSLRAVIDANGLQPPFILKVGQRLALPQGRRHRVISGDTLYGVAQRYDVDPYETARLNGLKPPFLIHVDEFLLIPVGDNAPPVAPVRVSSKAVTSESLVPPAVGSTSDSKSIAPPASRAPKNVSRTVRPEPQGAVPKVSQSASRSVIDATRQAPALPPGSRFIWPVEGRVITGFGARQGGLRNDGINISAPRGTPIRAADTGVVAYVGNELRGFGNLVLIKHKDGWISAYAHTERLNVRKGDKVRRGQKIASVGASGGVSRPQLHFELRRHKRAVDPRKYLAQATG